LGVPHSFDLDLFPIHFPPKPGEIWAALQDLWTYDNLATELMTSIMLNLEAIRVAAATVSDHLWMMGRDHDPTGACIPGAYIVKTHNLIDLGYAWTDDPSNNPSFPQFIKELESEFVGL
jgi:hypothetical protein